MNPIFTTDQNNPNRIVVTAPNGAQIGDIVKISQHEYNAKGKYFNVILSTEEFARECFIAPLPKIHISPITLQADLPL